MYCAHCTVCACFSGIAVLQLRKVEQRLRERKIQLRVTESAVELIGQMGYDPNYGARPVKRVIQHNVENELAKGILRGDYGEDDVVTIDTETLPPPPNGLAVGSKRLVFRVDRPNSHDVRALPEFSQAL